GLSVMRKQRSGDGGTTSGTLAYIAPEVLSGLPSDETSDLYAVGVIAYELFTGQHPFDLNSLTTLIHNILYTAPDLSRIGDNMQLRAVLGRLLAKNPQERYEDAWQVIEALSRATEQQLPLE